jgi:hypothetical protein
LISVTAGAAAAEAAEVVTWRGSSLGAAMAVVTKVVAASALARAKVLIRVVIWLRSSKSLPFPRTTGWKGARIGLMLAV